MTTSLNSSPQKAPDNSKSPFKITEKLKSLINAAVDNNKTNAAIVVGLVDPNGTQFYGYGKMSNAENNSTVDQKMALLIKQRSWCRTVYSYVNLSGPP
jgi:hypothetical protein